MYDKFLRRYGFSFCEKLDVSSEMLDDGYLRDG